MFSIDQRVRLTREVSDGDYNLPKGTVGSVTFVDNPSSLFDYEVSFDGEPWPVMAEEIEAVNE